MLDQTRQTFFSPEDDTLAAFLKFVGSAQTLIRIADYSFNLVPLVDLLLTKHQAGVDVALVLDRTQAAGATEKPQLDRLKVAGIPFVVGTSTKHKIMHAKFCVVEQDWITSGSWNYTAAASDEDNHLDLEHNETRAKWFLERWQEMWDWISANELQAGGAA